MDLVLLTSLLFLHGIKKVRVSDLDTTDIDNLVVQQQIWQEIREQLRSRFPTKYLKKLAMKHEHEFCQLKIDNNVLVGSENQKRIKLLIARVQEICTGKDGRKRVVKVNKKCLTRN
ncbi:DUF5641 domain-containing protein [Nephila pilipes]|uniref:DUF5641 domain-containing protein n=1 Tax=Nephila pilipes TaxID=299642 RepID=A0A8X6NUU5_NEPPI|nr:DUF5641 domain-containing protein [Nephila pilipes]